MVRAARRAPRVGLTLAALLLTRAAWCEPPRCRAPDRAALAAAKATFARGVEAYTAGRFEAAAVAWREAYALDCTAHALLLDVARAEERLGRLEDAAVALDAFLVARPDDRDASAVRDRAAALRERARVERAAARATGSPAPSVDGARPADETARAAPEARSPRAEAARTGAWITVGAGAGALTAGVVLFAVGDAQVRRADAQCDGRVCADADAAARGNDGVHLRGAGIAVGATGLVAVVAGAVWASATRSPALAVTPWVDPHRAGVAAAVQF